MFKVLLDADACPRTVFQILQHQKARYGFPLITVSSYNHIIQNEQHIFVGNEKEAADIAIMNHTEASDLVITQDYGLAALVLGKGAKALSPSGMEYTHDRMDFLLEERSLKAKVRRRGGKTKGPKARTKKDDERFTQSLNRLLKGLLDS